MYDQSTLCCGESNGLHHRAHWTISAALVERISAQKSDPMVPPVEFQIESPGVVMIINLKI